MSDTNHSERTNHGQREKHLRVQRGRSFTGCQACKARHLKCDEAKPQCKRCVKARISCQYPKTLSESGLPPNKFIIYAVPRALPDNPGLLPSERRSLHYFRCEAAFQLTAPFRSTLWVECVFQLAEQYSFVQSALVALSSMHESYTQPPALRNAYQAVAFHHYNKAIREITQVSGPGVCIRAILVSSVIFYTLESLRGSCHLALQHAQSGLKIMSQHRHKISSGSQQPSQLEKSLDRDFLALQNKCLELGTSKSRAYDIVNGFEPLIPNRFESVDDALYYTEVIFNDAHCLLDYVDSLVQSECAIGDNIIRELGPRYEHVCQRAKRWETAVVALEASLDRYSDNRYQQAYLILCTYRSVINVLLENVFADGDCFDRFHPGLAAILDYVEAFLINEDGSPTARQSSFSLSLGVIPPLLMLSCRCNYPPIRDRAVQLLDSRGRREGLYDTATALQIARRVIALRRQLCSTGNPRDVQVSSIKFVSETACKIEFMIVEGVPKLSPSPKDGWRIERKHVDILHLHPFQLLD